MIEGGVPVDTARRRIGGHLMLVLAPDQRGAAEIDARRLVEHVCGGRGREDGIVTDGEARLLTQLIARRVGGEPIARILGRKEFWSLDLELSKETLVPRPDTESIVEVALAGTARKDAALTVLDLGTGSGAILLAMLRELPNARGVGTDIAPGAVAAARRNAARLGLAARAAFAVMNWADALGAGADIVVANPPYIATAEIGGLSPEVRIHDPRLALDGGEDGLAAYRQVVPAIGRLLAAGGRGIVEVGAGQAGAVARLGTACGLVAKAHRDLSGIERALEFSRGC